MAKQRMVAMLVVAATLSLPAPVFANHGDPVYSKIYYSDATYTEQVGYAAGTCTPWGAGYAVPEGQTTSYVLYEHYGYCFRGEWHE